MFNSLKLFREEHKIESEKDEFSWFKHATLLRKKNLRKNELKLK